MNALLIYLFFIHINWAGSIKGDGWDEMQMKATSPVITNYEPTRKPNWKRYYKYHVKYINIIKYYANFYKIDKYIIEALITWESNWTTGGRNEQNCVGLMQVMGGSKNPEKNIKRGCNIYSNYRNTMFEWFKSKYNVEISGLGLELVALTAYNRGCGGAKKYYRKNTKLLNGELVINHSKFAKSVLWIYNKIKGGK